MFHSNASLSLLKQKNEIAKSEEYNCGYGVSKRSPAANYALPQQAASTRTKQSSKGKSSRDNITAAKGINAGTKFRRYITKYVMIWMSSLLIFQFLSFSIKTDRIDNLNLGVNYRYDNSLGKLLHVNVIYSTR